jgi:hypothetical protein
MGKGFIITPFRFWNKGFRDGREAHFNVEPGLFGFQNFPRLDSLQGRLHRLE